MKKFVAGFLTAAALAYAAPFNSTTTSRADLAFVDRVCFQRIANPDGGLPFLMVDSSVSVPIQTTLVDGGVSTTTDVRVGRFIEVRNTPRTQAIGYMDGAALTGGRDAIGLEQ